MGLILHIIIQFIGEVIFQVLFQLPFDWFFMKTRPDHLGRRKELKKLNILICMILGLCVGCISLVVYRYSMITNEWLRFLNIFITPYLVGKIIYYIHDHRTYEEERIYLFADFWSCYVFAFSLTFIRYVFLL